MVSRSLTLACLSLILVVSARADLNLSPTLTVFEGDGVKLHRLVFSDGSGKEITYQQPDGWQYSGDASKLTLYPQEIAQATGTITSVVLGQPGTLNEESRKKLTEEALGGIPRGSTNVTIVSQEMNPVKIGGKETFLVIVSYVFYGEEYERSVMFMNRGSEQIRFQLASRAADFKDLQRAFLASHFTWNNL
jgi:hypothetical protein